MSDLTRCSGSSKKTKETEMSTMMLTIIITAMMIFWVIFERTWVFRGLEI